MRCPESSRVKRFLIAAVTAALVVPATFVLATAPAEAATRCTQTVRGNHAGDIHVLSGQRVCLKHATENGNISVDAAGVLRVRASTVNGSVTLASGFRQFVFCGSQTVGGAVSATGATGRVTIGSNRRTCRGNTIGGALNIDSNSSKTTIARNTVGGAMTVNGDLLKTAISRNHISGALTCSNNNPDPVNAGHRNFVAGARTGETCANPTF